MATIVEMLDELEKVRLTPMVVPVLTMADPVLAAMPKGSLGALFSRRDTRESLIKTVEAFSPVLPDAIKFVGHVAESKLMTGLLSFWAAVPAHPDPDPDRPAVSVVLPWVLAP